MRGPVFEVQALWQIASRQACRPLPPRGVPPVSGSTELRRRRQSPPLGCKKLLRRPGQLTSGGRQLSRSVGSGFRPGVCEGAWQPSCVLGPSFNPQLPKQFPHRALANLQNFFETPTLAAWPAPSRRGLRALRNPTASTSEGRDNDPVDSAVGGLAAAGICAAGVAKAAEHDRHESKNSKPDPNDAAAAHVRVSFCAWSGTWLSMREISRSKY